MIRIYNSLSGRKEELRPIVPGLVRMYVCGMTVYDYCHLGHARPLIVFDVVRRHLRERGYRVEFVRNITDIDDKIIQRAAENGEAVEALTARFIAAMHEDCAALGVERPDHEPRATAYMPQIITMIAIRMSVPQPRLTCWSRSPVLSNSTDSSSMPYSARTCFSSFSFFARILLAIGAPSLFRMPRKR
jgi:DNA-dependent RNA polymerase auxiliary subunit epsilon